jgi:hypothetical protein
MPFGGPARVSNARNEAALTVEQSQAQAAFKMRNPRRNWLFGPGAELIVMLAALDVWMGDRRDALGMLAYGCYFAVLALMIRSFGVDLMPESAIVRGLRRRKVPWQDVQAVVQHRSFGTWGVRLILESGKPVMLRAPTTSWGFEGANYERDFHRIGQWWVEHRGASWRPLRPEAPQLPIHG